ncbi:hypothetical protein [Microcoleus sp. B4-C1]|uniref:hypothetical protein n=1 Tax=Microcoleus sp. B4-C1 TaxID=2818660 RepID=UPI002FD64355
MPTSEAKLRILRTIRGKDLKIRYTQDNLNEVLINQRQFYDEDGRILSPITPKLLERLIIGENSPIVARISRIEPRTAKACFTSAVNVSGESNFTVIIPYSPGDFAHNEHIREITDFISSSPNLSPPSPISVSYQGESQT